MKKNQWKVIVGTILGVLLIVSIASVTVSLIKQSNSEKDLDSNNSKITTAFFESVESLNAYVNENALINGESENISSAKELIEKLDQYDSFLYMDIFASFKNNAEFLLEKSTFSYDNLIDSTIALEKDQLVKSDYSLRLNAIEKEGTFIEQYNFFENGLLNSYLLSFFEDGNVNSVESLNFKTFTIEDKRCLYIYSLDLEVDLNIALFPKDLFIKFLNFSNCLIEDYPSEKWMDNYFYSSK